MFKDFFEKFGPVKGLNIKQRLSMEREPSWAQFLEHIGGPESLYYRYVFHQESGIDPKRRIVSLEPPQDLGECWSWVFRGLRRKKKSKR